MCNAFDSKNNYSNMKAPSVFIIQSAPWDFSHCS